MDKPEPLSDDEITAIWNRFIKQPYDGRTLSAIISHTAQAVAARYEAQIEAMKPVLRQALDVIRSDWMAQDPRANTREYDEAIAGIRQILGE